MAEKNCRKQGKISTIKLSSETKARLDHLKEFEKESYDEILRKILFVLNSLRNSPSAAAGILHNIDSSIKRKKQVYSGILPEKQENESLHEQNLEKNRQPAEKSPTREIQRRANFRKIIRR